MMTLSFAFASEVDRVGTIAEEGSAPPRFQVFALPSNAPSCRPPVTPLMTTCLLYTSVPINLFTGTRYFNLVGNVLGKPGYHDTYECAPPGGKNGNTAIYLLGWSGNEGSSRPPLKDDPRVAGTLVRWGNYDTVTKQAQWNPSEMPSGLVQLANSAPADHRLPNSFYLSKKPSWWGNMPWPAIGPDVTGGDDPTGHVYACLLYTSRCV